MMNSKKHGLTGKYSVSWKGKHPRKLAAAALSAAMVVSLLSEGAVPVSAAEGDVMTKGSSETPAAYEGYKLVWQDEFDGTELNTKDWNVEPHDPGWVNAELQAYPDAEHAKDNIYIKDGHLVIKPIATKKADAGTGAKEEKTNNLLKNPAFASTDGTTAADWSFGATAPGAGSVSYKDGKAVVKVENSGEDNWHVQLQQAKLTLTKGHKYHFAMKASADAERKVELSFLDPENGYDWYGGATESVTAAEKEIAFDLDCTEKNTSQTMSLQINFGLIGGSADDSKPATVTLSEISLTDLTDPSAGSNAYDDYTFTSGRINTENKHNFTYGMFETRAKVPKGKGYLPAFWLMAANENAEDEYGVWPTCGEIDMMEVLGDKPDTTHGTIHYGNPHKQNQGDYKLETGDFSSEYHTFRTEWLPGKIAWYVDDVKFYETSDWYSKKGDGKTLAYPAPFDHDMYVILNLAVGGEWVGYPDQAAIDDMVNQEYDIDYVRVYQKDSYDENVKEPEPEKVDLRQPGADGNYVVNGDFAAAEDLSENSGDWELLLAQNGEAAAEIKDKAITVKTTNAGDIDYSVQLVQGKLPMEQGKKYELSFDAKASENRQVQVAINAPDKGWIQYKSAEVLDLTTENKTFDFKFDMTSASDANGRLDFNMGHFGSVADVTVSNVVLKQIGDADAVQADTTKYPRSDGNRIYNGGFEEGTARLGYWEVAANDQAYVSVTNDAKDGKRIRRLKIDAPATVSAGSPIVISQPDIMISAGKDYELSYEVEGTAGKTVKLSIGGAEDTEVLTGSVQKIGPYVMEIPAGNTDRTFKITITEPGTYYIDNVMLKSIDNGLVKNGDFSDGQANWTPYVDSSAQAEVSYKEDAAGIVIGKTGKENWHVQLNQDNVTLEKGQKYKISLKAKSTKARKIEFSFQHNGASDDNWDSYTDGPVVASLTNGYQTFSKEFTMNAATDEAARFNIALGAIDGEEITEEHTVTIDDVVLEEVEDVTVDPEPVPADDTQKAPKKGDVVSAGSGAAAASYKVTKASGKNAAVTYQAPKKKTAKTISVPGTVKYKNTTYKVTAIAANACKKAAKMTKLTIGKNVVTIGKNAFGTAKKLKKVTIHVNSLKKVGKSAFKSVPKSSKFTLYAKSKGVYNKSVKMLKAAGAENVSFSYKKEK